MAEAHKRKILITVIRISARKATSLQYLALCEEEKKLKGEAFIFHKQLNHSNEMLFKLLILSTAVGQLQHAFVNKREKYQKTRSLMNCHPRSVNTVTQSNKRASAFSRFYINSQISLQSRPHSHHAAAPYLDCW